MQCSKEMGKSGMKKIDRFCEAIMWMEGWKPESRSYRNCNPGNLRWSKFQEDTEDNYAVFANFSIGWSALLFDVKCKCTGKTRTPLKPTSNIIDFFEVFAPYRDDNNPHHYADVACKRAKLDKHMQLKDLM